MLTTQTHLAYLKQMKMKRNESWELRKKNWARSHEHGKSGFSFVRRSVRSMRVRVPRKCTRINRSRYSKHFRLFSICCIFNIHFGMTTVLNSHMRRHAIAHLGRPWGTKRHSLFHSQCESGNSSHISLEMCLTCERVGWMKLERG